MHFPRRRQLTLGIGSWLMFVVSGCSLLDFAALSEQYDPNGGGRAGAGSGGQGPGGDAGEGGESGRAGTGNVGGGGTGGDAGGGAGGESGRGGASGGGSGGEPAMPLDGGVGGSAGDSSAPEVPPECANGRRDHEETDTDCGGENECPRCMDGDTCGVDRDCVNRRCQSGRCEPPTCDDNRKNGNETDIDCGGPDCVPCLLGDACEIPRDCEEPLNASNLCTEAVCARECDGAFLDCNTDGSCETDSNEVMHCGDCDVVCSDTNGTPDCNAGVCEPACDTGYDDCGGDNDGCETDIMTSETHCGGCGQACSSECIEGDCCPALAAASGTVTSCFTLAPQQANCALNVQNNGAAVGFTVTSTCNTTSGTLNQGVNNNFSTSCPTTFHLANDTPISIDWWISNCL